MKNIINIVLVGKPKTGKTLFLNNVANDFYSSDLHKENNSFNLRLYITEDRDKNPIEVRIWDLASKPCFYSVVSLPIKKADIIFYISNERFKVEEYIEYKALIDNFIKKECEIYYLENKKIIEKEKENLEPIIFLKHTYEINISNKKQCIQLTNQIIFNWIEKQFLYNKNQSNFLEKNIDSHYQPLLQKYNNKSNHKKNLLSKVWIKLKSLFCCNLND